MIEELVAAYGNRFLVAALGVSLALLCLFIVLWLLRRRAPSPFVRGGRNRQPRLQVLDAAAIDARRRLVLVRRDNVEHLVMIGGPTDIVIESGIGEERAYLSAVPAVPQHPVPLAHAERQDDREPPAIAKPQAAIAAARPEPELALSRPEPIAAAVRPEPPRRPTAPVKPVVEPLRAAAATAAIEPTVRRPPVAPLSPAAETAPAGPPASPAPIQPAAAPAPVKADAPAVITPVPVPEPTRTEAVVVFPADDAESRPAPVAATTPAAAASAQPATPTAQPFDQSVASTQEDEVSTISAEAEDILEAARGRVIPELAAATSPHVELEPALEPQPSGAPEKAEPEKQRVPSDFERVLEEEMERHLAAASAATPALSPEIPSAPAIRPERPAAIPPVAAVTSAPAKGQEPETAEEPSLQKEIARIFGEMSASRNG